MAGTKRKIKELDKKGKIGKAKLRKAVAKALSKKKSEQKENKSEK